MRRLVVATWCAGERCREALVDQPPERLRGPSPIRDIVQHDHVLALLHRATAAVAPRSGLRDRGALSSIRSAPAQLS
jgi:hypothetical protein